VPDRPVGRWKQTHGLLFAVQALCRDFRGCDAACRIAWAMLETVLVKEKGAGVEV
jgi:hypothetical protein